MAVFAKLKILGAILAIPAVLLGIGGGYKRGGLAGLHDLTLDVLNSSGLYREVPSGDNSNAALHEPGMSNPVITIPADELLWLTIKDSRATALFEEFLRKFRNSPRAQEARAKLEAVKNAPQSKMQQPQIPMQEQGQRPNMMMSPGTQGPKQDGGG
jgi:hypothetical protein